MAPFDCFTDLARRPATLADQDLECRSLFAWGQVLALQILNEGQDVRLVERPRVPIDEWMNDLQPGDAWVRVAPIDGRWRQTRVRVAMPRPPELGQGVRSMVSVKGSVIYAEPDRRTVTETPSHPESRASTGSAYAQGPRALLSCATRLSCRAARADGC